MRGHGWGALDGVLTRAADPVGLALWEEQVRSIGGCSHPVRLVGTSHTVRTSTGELLGVFDTRHQPDGIVLKACGNRRADVCPACSRRYQTDAWHLITAGMRGGKGVPGSVATHPQVFLTLTAPSFGPVHSRRVKDGRARQCRRSAGRCIHGVDLGCRTRHGDDDLLLGQALCGDCFDYAAAVLWNAHSPRLWNRTTQAARRALAKCAGVSARTLREHVRLVFVKVVEYQARGVIHLHVLARLDAPGDGSPEPPEARWTVELLLGALDQARATIVPAGSDTVGWGSQYDAHPVTGLDPVKVAGYLAKYATKAAGSTTATADNTHDTRLIAAALHLSRDPEWRDLHLARDAEAFGFPGHWASKSPTYSTTFTRLRAARANHRLPGGDDVARDSALRYTGSGYRTPGDAWLAQSVRRDIELARVETRVRPRREAT